MDESKETKQPSEERPLECSECKRPITVRYTVVVGDSITHTVMCAECPQLQQRLHGIPTTDQKKTERKKTGLCCGTCGTTLDEVRRGNDLGCADCYEVFGEVIWTEMLAANKISPRMGKKKKIAPGHIGRQPGEVQEMGSSLQLLALNEALSETLRREDYEQAAWLRDQIKELTEEDGKKEK